MEIAGGHIGPPLQMSSRVVGADLCVRPFRTLCVRPAFIASSKPD
jgi:hypothetical protein